MQKFFFFSKDSLYLPVKKVKNDEKKVEIGFFAFSSHGNLLWSDNHVRKFQKVTGWRSGNAKFIYIYIYIY